MNCRTPVDRIQGEGFRNFYCTIQLCFVMRRQKQKCGRKGELILSVCVTPFKLNLSNDVQNERPFSGLILYMSNIYVRISFSDMCVMTLL